VIAIAPMISPMLKLLCVRERSGFLEPYSLRVKVRCGGHENLFLLEIRIFPKGTVEAADADLGSTST
jgi:hypothetical protein